MIDVWESRAAWHRFRTERLEPVSRSLPRPPVSRELELEHVVVGAERGSAQAICVREHRWMEVTMSTTPRHHRDAPRLALCALLLLTGLLATAASAAPGAACGICGKNLIKNPGADLGAGITAVDAFGAVPGWTNEAGQFGAASYTFPNGWFSSGRRAPKTGARTTSSAERHRAAVEVPATIGKQTIKLPAAAAGRKATLSGWLGNYGKNYAQVRAQFEDASGSALGSGQDRPGHDHLRHRHAGEEPEHQGARRRQAGHDRRVVRRRRRGLQARGGRRPLARPRLRRPGGRGDAARAASPRGARAYAHAGVTFERVVEAVETAVPGIRTAKEEAVLRRGSGAGR